MKRKRIDVFPHGEGRVPFSVEVDEAETFFERARGLIGRARPPAGRGLLIPKCNSIHTFFMGFPIDVYFLDRAGRLVKAVRGVKPWRPFIWGGWRSVQAIETAAGAFSY